MPTIEVLSDSKNSSGNVDLASSVFEAPVKMHLLHAEVRRQLASRRAGTASTKNRHAVSGGGAKPYKQKGTGRARQGTIRAPQYKGGGAVFGPVPRKYDHKLTKKMKKGALRSALSYRMSSSDLIVVEDFVFTEFKTRVLLNRLKDLGCGESVLIVTSEEAPYLVGSARNLPYVDVILEEGLNVHAILGHEKLVFTRAAVESTNSRLGTEDGVK
tara:strand:- start:4467 stop:5108 length:642 start_codon:yes stop_codon:yes gene_type:complete